MLSVLLIVLLAVPMVVALIVCSSILNGWVLSILWGWFMVPIFGLPVLSIVQAIGLCLVIGFIRGYHPHPKNKDETNNEKIANLCCHIVFPFLALLIGYIVTLFM